MHPADRAEVLYVGVFHGAQRRRPEPRTTVSTSPRGVEEVRENAMERGTGERDPRGAEQGEQPARTECSGERGAKPPRMRTLNETPDPSFGILRRVEVVEAEQLQIRSFCRPQVRPCRRGVR